MKHDIGVDYEQITSQVHDYTWIGVKPCYLRKTKSHPQIATKQTWITELSNTENKYRLG